MPFNELKQRYKSLLPELKAIADSLKETISDGLDSIEFIDSVNVRVKGRDSLYIKVRQNTRKYTLPFKDVEDLIGVRVLVLFPQTAGEVFERLTGDVLPPIESGYRQCQDPSAFGYEGYQSIHTIPRSALSNTSPPKDYPKVFELQIRTLFQHAALETQHEMYYKNCPSLSKPKLFEYKKRLAWLAASAWGSDQVLKELRRTQADAAES